MTCYCRRKLKRLLQISFLLAIAFGLGNVLNNLRQSGSITTIFKGRLAQILYKPITEDQKALDYMATTIQVYFEFLTDDSAEITFLNKGSKTIENNGWAIYFDSKLEIAPFDMDEDFENIAAVKEDRRISISRVDGLLYKFKPATKNFTILSGESVRCKVKTMEMEGKTRFLVSPNWYIVIGGLKPKTITSTADEELSFVSYPNGPHYNGISHMARDLGGAPFGVIPTPKEFTTGPSSKTKKSKVYVNKEWMVFANDSLQNERHFLSGKLGLKESSSSDRKSKVILLNLLSSSDARQDFIKTQEKYDLQVDASKEIITISAQESVGIFYGVQTLLSLINDKGEVPHLSVKDWPRFSYRGLMIDVARNFKTKDEILKILDAMAMYKMNKFHFHLSDSEGWRLEIPGLEELTTVGARRCHDLEEKTCILPNFGSGPDNSTAGTGYYSTEDYREILRHAKELHIQVIPEFDFPGHSHAAINSMFVRHNKQAQQGEGTENFLLNDLEDTSRYSSLEGFSNDAINPCLSSTYRFLDHLLSELTRLHVDTQPLRLFHLGGDEVPLGVWMDSPACRNVTRKIARDEYFVRKHLMQKFITKLSRITKEHGAAIGGWSDAFVGQREDTEFSEMQDRYVLSRQSLNSDPVAYLWGGEDQFWKVFALMEKGYKIVLLPSQIVYLDHSSEQSFEERGFNWATTYSDIRKIFEYSPPRGNNILGMEGAMWSELIRTADQMHSMVFPRLLAIAERAWHNGTWEDLEEERREDAIAEDWVKFANTVGYKELRRLDKMGVAYRVPPPKARVICREKCDKVQVTTELPGLKIEYSTDRGQSWNDVTPEMEVKGKIKLRTRSADMARFSRVIEFEHWIRS